MVKEGLEEVGMIGTSDKELLEDFLDYLLKLIYTKDSVILNPLDSDNRDNILDKIFKKPGIIKPKEKLNSISFS